MIDTPISDLRWLQVLLNNLEVDTEGCWLMTKYVRYQRNGYSELVVNLGVTTKSKSAHRFSYTFFVGSIPEGYQVDHQCHDPALCFEGDQCKHRRCVNPSHLKAVPAMENKKRQNRSRTKGNKAKTHCSEGHEYSAENTYIRRNGSRKCRRCNADQEQKRRDKSRGKIFLHK
jgi:hypothetical protein